MFHTKKMKNKNTKEKKKIMCLQSPFLSSTQIRVLPCQLDTCLPCSCTEQRSHAPFFNQRLSFVVFREANQLSEEMGKETEFAVTLQVQSSTFTSERMHV